RAELPAHVLLVHALRDLLAPPFGAGTRREAAAAEEHEHRQDEASHRACSRFVTPRTRPSAPKPTQKVQRPFPRGPFRIGWMGSPRPVAALRTTSAPAPRANSAASPRSGGGLIV